VQKRTHPSSNTALYIINGALPFVRFAIIYCLLPYSARALYLNQSTEPTYYARFRGGSVVPLLTLILARILGPVAAAFHCARTTLIASAQMEEVFTWRSAVETSSATFVY
jgi:hypothetical protein